MKTWSQTFVDTSRPTPAGPTAPESPQRTLVTTIYRPDGKGPFPLVVFSHGSNGHPEKFTRLLGAWAAAGYVVVAPAFPRTNSHVPQDDQVVGDVAQQPADVSFVIDEVLGLNRSRKSRLHGAIDPTRIGAGGLSLGGATTYGVAFDDGCIDERICAAEVLDGFVAGLGERSATNLDGHIPLLIAHSDTDPVLPYARAQQTFVAAESPVWFVTLHGASHATQWEDDLTPYDQIGIAVTIDFWDATLGGKAQTAFAQLERDATVEGLSSIEVRR